MSLISVRGCRPTGPAYKYVIGDPSMHASLHPVTATSGNASTPQQAAAAPAAVAGGSQARAHATEKELVGLDKAESRQGAKMASSGVASPAATSDGHGPSATWARLAEPDAQAAAAAHVAGMGDQSAEAKELAYSAHLKASQVRRPRQSLDSISMKLTPAE